MMNQISRKFPFEIAGIECGVVVISINIASHAMAQLVAAGVGETELPNYLYARMGDIIAALDGDVPGLVISDLEHI